MPSQNSGDDGESHAPKAADAAHKEPSEDGEVHKSTSESAVELDGDTNPPLPLEEAPPLPAEPPPGEDDGWSAIWDDNAQAFYFHNRFTQQSQWNNPRVPDSSQQPGPPGVGNYDRMGSNGAGEAHGDPQPAARDHRDENLTYNPAIHGDYDPTAPYAQKYKSHLEQTGPSAAHVSGEQGEQYYATGTFNRFTGKWQSEDINPENHNDESKSKRQMSAFFDVDSAANNHNGKSLKAERAGKKLSKAELKAFKEKRKEKKEERRRAWLRD